MDWSYFNKIRTISLEERGDRRIKCQTIFDKYKINNEFFIAQRNPKGGELGCWESHMSVIKEAYEAGVENLLIFEDDCLDTKHLTKENLDECIKFMKENNDWNILLLGSIPQILFFPATKIKGYKNIYLSKAWATHAYVINRKFMPTIMNIKYTGTPLDDFYSNFGNVYTHTPSMFIQDDMGSDIQSFDTYWAKSAWNNYCEWHIQNNAPPLLYVAFALALFLLIPLILTMIYPKGIYLWIGLSLVIFVFLLIFKI